MLEFCLTWQCGFVARSSAYSNPYWAMLGRTNKGRRCVYYVSKTDVQRTLSGILKHETFNYPVPVIQAPTIVFSCPNEADLFSSVNGSNYL